MFAGKVPHLHQLFRDRELAHDKYDPSCIYELHAVNKVHNIREYCINYLFNEKEDSSCSENKYRLVKKLFLKLKEENNLPDYIFSVSTSASTYYSQGGDGIENTVNGCVFMGNNFLRLILELKIILHLVVI